MVKAQSGTFKPCPSKIFNPECYPLADMALLHRMRLYDREGEFVNLECDPFLTLRYRTEGVTTCIAQHRDVAREWLFWRWTFI
jgi:hypothetical protein